MLLSAQGRIRQFTGSNKPSKEGYITHQIERSARTIVLDDGSTQQNRSPSFYPQPGFTYENAIRSGDAIENLKGVLNYGFSTWRIQPVVENYEYQFTAMNPREYLETDSEADITVASFNVLNCFVTLDDSGSVCGATADQSCRGADSREEFERQQSKLINALCELDADVVGLMELENPRYGSTEKTAVQNLVEALNYQCGYYQAINTGTIGSDAISAIAKVVFAFSPAFLP